MRSVSQVSSAAVDAVNQLALILPVVGPTVQTVEWLYFRSHPQHYSVRRHLKFCNAVRLGGVADLSLLIMGIALECFAIKYKYLFMARAFVIAAPISIIMRICNHEMLENLFVKFERTQ